MRLTLQLYRIFKNMMRFGILLTLYYYIIWQIEQQEWHKEI
jgi:hypothetical protein